MNGTGSVHRSEPLSPANADKRNRQYEATCLANIAFNTDTSWERRIAAAKRHDVPRHEIPDQYIRILRWLDTPGEEPLEMDEPPFVTLRRLSDQPKAHGQDPHSGEPENHDFNFEWLGIIEAAGLSGNTAETGCLPVLLPQLFYGHWIPFVQPPGSKPPHQLQAEMLADIERLRSQPLYLPQQ